MDYRDRSYFLVYLDNLEYSELLKEIKEGALSLKINSPYRKGATPDLEKITQSFQKASSDDDLMQGT